WARPPVPRVGGLGEDAASPRQGLNSTRVFGTASFAALPTASGGRQVSRLSLPLLCPAEERRRLGILRAAGDFFSMRARRRGSRLDHSLPNGTPTLPIRVPLTEAGSLLISLPPREMHV